MPDGLKGTPDPFVLVIFGASGDLTRRKLIPAVYSVYRDGLLPDAFSVLGFARSEKSDEEFRDEMREALRVFARVPPAGEAEWAKFASRLHYQSAQSYDSLEDYVALRERLVTLGAGGQSPGDYLFYLAAQPDLFPSIVDRLHEAGLSRREAERGPWSRIVIEKPFGRDLTSARRLNEHVQKCFRENQVYRIDHYLGKETVQNLLVFRFANSIFEPIWNHNYIDHVQMTVSETVGVERRGKYYEQAGALRDMVQNHMMHLLCLVAMEAPVSLNADAVRDEKVKVLQAVRPIPEECLVNGVVRAQYACGTIQGEAVPGYRDEEGVAADSGTETFVAFKTFIDNWRWAGVPFYLRTGKRLPARITEIDIHFKSVPRVLFNADPSAPMTPNVLALRVQPNEGIMLQFQVKAPGPAMQASPHKMDFGYAESFGKEPPEAYERLLLDAALGDPTLFTRSDEVEAAWRFVSPVVEGCAQQHQGGLPTYPAGSWGPREADELIAADGRRWQIMRRPAPKADAAE